MPTITRSYSIEYGTTVIGGASDKFILRKRGFGIFESYRKARLTFEVIVRGDTVTEFKDNNIELLDAFRTPRQRLKIQCPEDLRDYNPSSLINSGFDAEPDIEVVAERLNGPKFRNYRCSINIDLPADLSGQAGRRDNTVDTSTDSNRRLTVTLSGVYTALGTNDASAQYAAQIQNHADDVLPAGNWQYLRQNVSRNDTDKIVKYSRIYKEITHDQGNGSATHASVIEQELTMSKSQPGAPNTFIFGRTTRPLVVYSVKYNAVIDKTVTGSTALRALYDNELRAKVLADVASNLASPGGGSTDNEKVALDLENNVITATFDFRKPLGSNIIKSRMTKDLVTETGKSLIPVTTGFPHHHAEDDGPPSLILRVMIEETIVSGTFSRYATPKGFVLMRVSESAVQVEEGRFPASLTTKTKSRNYEFKYSIPYRGKGSVAKVRVPSEINNFNGQGV